MRADVGGWGSSGATGDEDITVEELAGDADGGALVVDVAAAQP
jgi:hypothetical protein